MGPQAVSQKNSNGHKALVGAADAVGPFARATHLFGEDGPVPVRPFLNCPGGDIPVPTRVPVHYTYPEMFGNAEVQYAFPLGTLVRLASGGASRVEALRPGQQFRLDGGGTATVTQVDPLMPWPEADTSPTFNREEGRRVVGRVKHAGAIVLDVTYGGKTVTTTPNHLFWSVTRNDWIAAGKLRRGELLKDSGGQGVPVEGIGTPRKLLVDLYNLEVEVEHTYFVGDPPVLVHNGYSCIKLPASLEEDVIAADGLSIKSPNGIGIADSQLHHIATIYEGSGKWATQFEAIFNKAGYTLEDGINKILVEGHFGGHPDLYHELVLAALDNATSGLQGTAYTAAFENAMSVLRTRVTDVNDILNALITR